MVHQLEAGARCQLADDALPPGLMLFDLTGFQQIPDPALALVQVPVFAGPGVIFLAGSGSRAGLAQQTVLRAAEVIIVAGNGIHGHLAAGGKLEDDGLTDHLNVIAQLEGGAFQGPEGPAVVTNHQDMPVFPVLKVIMNPFFAQQSLNEIQLRFIVLDTIRPGLIGASQLKTIAGRIESGFGQQLLQDLGSGQVLENAQIMAQPQPIEARSEMNSIISPTAAGLELNGSPDGAMYQAGRLQKAGARVDLQQGVAAQQLFQFEGGVTTDHFNGPVEQSGNGFSAVETKHPQFVFAPRYVECKTGAIGG